jgi:hypothetical protein
MTNVPLTNTWPQEHLPQIPLTKVWTDEQWNDLKDYLDKVLKCNDLGPGISTGMPGDWDYYRPIQTRNATTLDLVLHCNYEDLPLLINDTYGKIISPHVLAWRLEHEI